VNSVEGGGNELLYRYHQQEKKKLSEHLTLKENVFVSCFEGFSLKEYKDARTLYCNERHSQPCKECTGMINVADTIIAEGFMSLKSAFLMSTKYQQNRQYKAFQARRKLLPMPLSCIGIGSQQDGTHMYYLVEKQDSVDYSVFRSLLMTSTKQKRAQKVNISRDELNKLIYLSETDSQREILKYVVVKASGISSTQAKKSYGFSDVQKRVNKVEEALKTSQAIRESVEKIACIKDKALLASFGFEFDESEVSKYMSL